MRFLSLTLGGILIFCSGCSVRKFAVNQIANSLAEGGSSFSSDNDPELIRDAAPFSLKLMESLLAETPNHRGLLLSTCSGFTQYAYGFVHQNIDAAEEDDLATAEQLRVRARKLYLRARDYGLRGLALRQPDFALFLRKDPNRAVSLMKKRDVGFLYWTGAAWGAAISVSKDQPELVADLPIVEALLDRALELDESYDFGAIHSLMISYELARPAGVGDPIRRATNHFERSVELSHGQLVAPYVSFAENVCIQQQDRPKFEALLRKALAIDLDKEPQWRLVNVLMQDRARWLLSQTDDLFID